MDMSRFGNKVKLSQKEKKKEKILDTGFDNTLVIRNLEKKRTKKRTLNEKPAKKLISSEIDLVVLALVSMGNFRPV